jgi:hypothetical protein
MLVVGIRSRCPHELRTYSSAIHIRGTETEHVHTYVIVDPSPLALLGNRNALEIKLVFDRLNYGLGAGFVVAAARRFGTR